MSEERQDARGEEKAGEVKVVDRRRFRPDGAPVEAGAEAGEAQAAAKPDVVTPEPAVAEAAPAPDARDQRLAAQEQRIDELTRAYAALVEDNKAFRQRLEREKVRVLDAERTSLAQSILEAADDLERALSAVSASDVEAPSVKNLVEGVRLSLAALHKRIGALGAERIPVAGQPFDPHVAEAVDTVAVADAAQDGCVVQEVQSGYRIGDRLLRPARVRVGKLARA